MCTIWVVSFAQPLQNPATIGSSSRNQRIIKSLAVGDSLLTGGVVGINTDTPTTTLDVNGSMRVRGLGAGSVISNANGVLSIGSVAPIARYFITYAQASDSVSDGNLTPLAWYNITDDSIYLQAITDSSFALNGYYADSVIWELDAIQFDFANEHIQQRCDKRGNCVGSTYTIDTVMGINPIDVFPWGNDNCLGNIVKDAVFDFTGNLDPSASGNNILFLSEVAITTNEQFWNNTFINSTGSILDTARVSYGNFESSDITVTDNAGLLNGVANNGEITLSGEVLAQGLNVTTNSKVTATNSATIISALLRKGSVLIVSDTVDANGIELWEGDTVILSGTVNAINCRLYTGADIIASGAIFIEGMVIQNVSKFYGSGTGSISPSFICNQSTVTVSGNVDMANNYISSSVVGFTDSTRCQNCWFYSVVDTFNGVTLDTFAYSIINRSTFYKTIDVDTFSLTNGTQGAGKVLTDVTGNGKGIWQDHTAYGEMGFGDSTRTIALTQNVFRVVTNSNKTLWSTAAIDLHNVTYSGDSLIIDSAGTYQVNVQLSMDGTSGSVIRLGVFLNGVLACTCTGYQELLNNRILQLSYINIDALNAGDVLQVVITNTANNDDVDAVGGKITVNKIR